jgi:hypothetical protein
VTENRLVLESSPNGTIVEHDGGYRRSVIAVAYWAAWVALGIWGFRLLFAYRRSAWWMVMAAFLLTQDDILPAHQVRRPLRVVALASASLACGMLLYGTSDWWFSVLEGWHSASNDPLLRQTLQRLWFPTLYILGTLLSAGMLVVPFRRALGPYIVLSLATVGSLATIWVQSDSILSLAAWRHDWLLSALLLFRAIIVGLGSAALAARFGPPGHRRAWCPLCERIWRGRISVRLGLGSCLVALFVSLALTIAGSSYAVHRQDGSLQVGKMLIFVFFTEILPIVVFVAGCLIALRTLNAAAARRPWSSRVAQTIIVLMAAPVVVGVARSNGLFAGEKLVSLLAVDLGTAYSYRVSPDGSDLFFQGHVTYGVADQLKQELGSNPLVRRLTLSSGGGNAQEAIDAGAIIHEDHLDTFVQSSCESACVFMFLAGEHRNLGTSGKLGFHETVPLNPLAGRGNVSLCYEYARYSVSEDFCRKVEAVVPPAIWYPTREELVAANVVSAPTEGHPTSVP